MLESRIISLRVITHCVTVTVFKVRTRYLTEFKKFLGHLFEEYLKKIDKKKVNKKNKFSLNFLFEIKNKIKRLQISLRMNGALLEV